jgi:V/A-type H+-transporting ATPase subunit G/H
MIALSSLEVMKKIVDAEKQSQEMLETSKLEISEMKRNIPDRTTSMRQEILRKANEERQKALAEADAVGAQEADKIAAETKKQVQSLSQISRDKINQAVEAAIKLLLS